MSLRKQNLEESKSRMQLKPCKLIQVQGSQSTAQQNRENKLGQVTYNVPLNSYQMSQELTGGFRPARS